MLHKVRASGFKFDWINVTTNDLKAVLDAILAGKKFQKTVVVDWTESDRAEAVKLQAEIKNFLHRRAQRFLDIHLKQGNPPRETLSKFKRYVDLTLDACRKTERFESERLSIESDTYRARERAVSFAASMLGYESPELVETWDEANHEVKLRHEVGPLHRDGHVMEEKLFSQALEKFSGAEGTFLYYCELP